MAPGLVSKSLVFQTTAIGPKRSRLKPATTDYWACVQSRYRGRRMGTAMKFEFRLYRRGRTYYVQDYDTRAQES